MRSHLFLINIFATNFIAGFSRLRYSASKSGSCHSMIAFSSVSGVRLVNPFAIHLWILLSSLRCLISKRVSRIEGMFSCFPIPPIIALLALFLPLPVLSGVPPHFFSLLVLLVLVRVSVSLWVLVVVRGVEARGADEVTCMF